MRRDAFTLPELLLAVALSALVAAILFAILRGLFSADGVQSRVLSGPIAARSALRRLADEASCAFVPPGMDSASPADAPFGLSRSSDWGEPELRLAFYLPIRSREPFLPGFHGIERVLYEVRPVAGAPVLRELVRRSSPCAGPRTNDVSTLVLLRGPFHLDISIPESSNASVPPADIWPPDTPADQEASSLPSSLPSSLRFSLRFSDSRPLETETLVHCAQVLPAPEAEAPVP